ncbi:M48 family metallopeptidase [Sediminibacterium soli]|uniref:M48 family metallopeptidase n=1 Tax=Sediminibacterium soli TaxID=2698829 RepID=UPI00137AA5C9|nr:M48 family metallopeptidase [Sediminibacterium soli]NCI46067.1 M48 family metallopeptidase [Sediminibacterium soli]
MKQFFAVLAFAVLAFACSRNAITGRSQLSLVSEADLQAMAETQYADFLSKNRVISSGAPADMVRRVGSRIASAVQQYYRDKNIPADDLNNYRWAFNLVENPQVNAWCMPGGKVVVYTGILPVTQTESALAIVLGHEITHAVVGHGRERMSQELAAQGLGALGGAALGSSTKAAGIFNSVYGIGAQYGVLLPFSRKQELEADHYGLIFAAIAGYDPRVAIDFWTRMASMKNGQAPPEILSSHPSDAERIQQIRDIMPEALTYYAGK